MTKLNATRLAEKVKMSEPLQQKFRKLLKELRRGDCEKIRKRERERALAYFMKVPTYFQQYSNKDSKMIFLYGIKF